MTRFFFKDLTVCVSVCVSKHMHRCENTHLVCSKTSETTKCLTDNQVRAHLTKMLKMCCFGIVWSSFSLCCEHVNECTVVIQLI